MFDTLDKKEKETPKIGMGGMLLGLALLSVLGEALEKSEEEETDFKPKENRLYIVTVHNENGKGYLTKNMTLKMCQEVDFSKALVLNEESTERMWIATGKFESDYTFVEIEQPRILGMQEQLNK